MLCAFLGVLLRRFSQVGMRRAGNGVGECYNCISRVSLMILSCHICASSYAVFHIAVQKKQGAAPFAMTMQPLMRMYAVKPYCCAIDTTTIDAISTARPISSTAMVFMPAPFHSFRIMPHTFDAMTLSDMRMLHEKA